MAKVDVADKKLMAAFSNEVKYVKAVHDFAVDGGAFADEHVLFEANEDIVIHYAVTKIKTAYTSGGLATAIIGVQGGDAGAILASTAVTAMTLNATFPNNSASNGLRVASGGKIELDIGVADMTAGKMEVMIAYSQY